MGGDPTPLTGGEVQPFGGIFGTTAGEEILTTLGCHLTTWHLQAVIMFPSTIVPKCNIVDESLPTKVPQNQIFCPFRGPSFSCIGLCQTLLPPDHFFSPWPDIIEGG